MGFEKFGTILGKYSFGFGKPALENIRERLVHFKVTLHEWRRRVETNEQAWRSSRVRDAYKDLIQAYDEKLEALWVGAAEDLAGLLTADGFEVFKRSVQI